MKKDLIAPCGMNCRLCISFQAMTLELKKKGFNRKYCRGCIPRGENCTHMGDSCELLRTGAVRFCYKCDKFPCKRLKALDKRYRTKYHMSMIENLQYIKENGMDAFLKRQEEIWKCQRCGGAICCHNGLCLSCDLKKLQQNKRYRWGEVEVR
ncbi:DUF3795 domain-containing protein [Alkalibacter saccharofermentans]|uniref:DUF3795 domain-containing protein n=1 Tax=Alkalibacter saccharofermentans DSM 14828 TaxID=1120975 RepID=A0A1M4WE22_9FIRM|nr:DUF3795 domain-containing protein [Alkalibacter saccharofermentans]SHE79425.1 Protein of unknown function [Alkalibacter saccharofermentans DSM 14828]